MASRGIFPEKLENCELQWQGPIWLKESSSPWSSLLDDLFAHKPIVDRAAYENASIFPSAHLTQKIMPEVWDLSSFIFHSILL